MTDRRRIRFPGQRLVPPGAILHWQGVRSLPRPARRVLLLLVLLSPLLCLTLGQLAWRALGSGAAAVIGRSVVPGTAFLALSEAGGPLAGKVILLDPGHGGADPGCVYPAEHPELLESSINLQVAKQAKQALEQQGATVVLLRTADVWSSLYQRLGLTHLYCLQYASQVGRNPFSQAEQAELVDELEQVVAANSNLKSAQGIFRGPGVSPQLRQLMQLEQQLTDLLLLSIHVNSNQDSSPHGTQVYYINDAEANSQPSAENYTGRNGPQNAALAEHLYAAITAAVPELRTSAQATLPQNLAVLREHNLTGVLIELGFITNPIDRVHLASPQSIEKICAGIAQGCIRFFADRP